MVDQSIRLLSAWLEREQGVVASPEALIELERVVEDLGALACDQVSALPFGGDPTGFLRLFDALAEKQHH